MTSIQFLYLIQSHIVDAAAAIGRAVHGVVVYQDQDAVGRAVHVHFQHVNAQLGRVFEGKHRIARPQPVAALMGDDPRPGRAVGEERMWFGRLGQDDKRSDDYH